MNVINETFVEAAIDQLGTIVGDAVEVLKAYGEKLRDKVEQEAIPLLDTFLKNMTGEIKGVAFGKEVETLDLATLVEFAKKYVVPNSNEIVALKVKEEDSFLIYLSYSKDRNLLPVASNKYLIIKTHNLAEDVNELFKESELVILK